MKLAVILVLVVAVVSAVILVQTGVRFSPEATSLSKKPVKLSKTCSKDNDCKITSYCPPKTKCIRFFDDGIKFSCQNGKCVVNKNQ